ncbi:hypothetical protein DL765_001160 [Monosporascus sp. GIB2]|nr:hypothetical protein DL765_001160 [Monosporascus sp. GIB2]
MPSGGIPPRWAASSQDGFTERAEVASAAQDADSLLACLACAQFRHVDFTGISWVEAQGELGAGGQASILETRADAKTVLAFRRHTPPKKGILRQLSDRVSSYFSGSVASTRSGYRQIASEILALGHPQLRSHPNIVRLIAISWEIREQLAGKAEIWPVLLFEKTEYKDLEHFMRDPDGKRKSQSISMETRLKMCAEIAGALEVIHRHDIIHGDVKPENILVFGESPNAVVAKIADFGYSTVGSRDHITVAESSPWVAPEVGTKDDYTLDEAKKIDIYSFGMLCLWLLFMEKLATMGGTNSGKSSDKSWPPDLDILGYHNVANKSKNTVQELALDLVEEMPSDDSKKPVLRKLFNAPIGDGDEQATALTAAIPRPSDFRVVDALQSLCLADQRVRKGIFRALSEEYERAKEPREKANLAMQIAVSNNIGFGTSKNADAAAQYIREAEKLVPERDLSTYLNDAISTTRKKDIPSDHLLKKLYDTGVILPIHNALDFRSLSETQMVAMREARREEFEQMQSSLGSTHPAVLNLKWTFSTMLAEIRDPEPTGENMDRVRERSDFLRAIADDLARDAGYGKDHIDTVMAYTYYALGLIMTPAFDALEESIARCRTLLQRLSQAGLDIHVATVMICRHLSSALGTLLRFKEAGKYLREARERTHVIFGDRHPNTVMLLIDEAKNLAQQGKISEAEEKQRECLERMKPLVGEKSMEFLQLQGGLVEHLVAFGQFEEAHKELQLAKAMLHAHNFDEKHPGYIKAHQTAMRINLGLHKYEEANEDADKCLAIMKRFPWPPPAKYVMKDLPDPNLFPRDPTMMLVEATRSIALVARYHDAATTGQVKLAARFEKTAEDCLATLLREINQCFGRARNKAVENTTEETVLGSSSPGSAGSPMYQAMEEGPSIPIELLAVVGADNARSGRHYSMAIRVARQLKMQQVENILVEHQALCSPASSVALVSGGGADDDRSFATSEDLAAWITGTWRGTYLTKGGLRKKLKWKRTLYLKPVENGKEDVPRGTLRIEGTADDEEAGSWTIHGTASTSGSISLLFHITGLGTKEHAWEYAGLLHRSHRALGGSWHMQGLDYTGAGGTFFFYKD